MGLGKCHRVLKSVNAVYTSFYRGFKSKLGFSFLLDFMIHHSGGVLLKGVFGPIKEVKYQCTLFLHFWSTWGNKGVIRSMCWHTGLSSMILYSLTAQTEVSLKTSHLHYKGVITLHIMGLHCNMEYNGIDKFCK